MKKIYNSILTIVAVAGAFGTSWTASASENGNLPPKAEDAVTWESRGKVTFVEGFFSAFKELPQGEELQVEMEEAKETPGLYRLVNPYAEWSAVKDGKVEYDKTHNYYFIIHAEDPTWVWAEGGELGVSMSGLPTKLHSNVHALIASVGLDVMKEKKPEAGGELVGGVISFPVSFKNGYQISTFAVTAKGVQWPANAENKLRIKFAGAVEPDYSLKIDTKECIGIGDPIKVRVTAGAGIKQIKVRVMPETHIGQGSYFDQTADEGTTLVSGETFSCPPKEGQDMYTVSVVGINANGKQKAWWLTWVSVYKDEKEGWNNLGEGTFKDAVLPVFGYCEENHSYSVQVQEKASQPGLFRIVDPFKNHPVAAKEGKLCDEDHSHYLYIDATVPDEVKVKHSNSGLNMGDGMLNVWSTLDSSGEPAKDLIAYGYKIASYDKATRTITFPSTSLLVGCSEQNYCELMPNWTGGSLVLPESTGIQSVESEETPIEWYDLSGIKVDRPGKGLYIMKKNGRVQKVMR